MRLAQTGISNNFMHRFCWMKTQPGSNEWHKLKVTGTNRVLARGALGSIAFRYACAFVLALWFPVLAGAAEPLVVDLKLPAHFDPYAVDATAQYEAAARVACAEPKPPGFIGYRWNLPPIAAELRLLTGTSEGKQIYIGFLKSQYGYQIARLNADYGTDAQSFTELLESPMTHVDGRDKVRRDDAEFDRDARREMLSGILAALRQCDSAHALGVIRALL